MCFSCPSKVCRQAHDAVEKPDPGQRRLGWVCPEIVVLWRKESDVLMCERERGSFIRLELRFDQDWEEPQGQLVDDYIPAGESLVDER